MRKRLEKDIALRDGTTIHECKVARISRDGNIGYLFEHPVEEVAGQLLRDRHTLATAALAVHNLVSVAPALEHLGNQLRRVL